MKPDSSPVYESAPLACVIFDMDGTVTRTNELIFASFNHVARKYLRKTLEPREIIALFGPPEEGALTRLLGEAHAAEAMEDLCAFYHENHQAMASLQPGIEDVLRFLRESGVKQALFTGKGARTTGITLRALHIHHYFDQVVTGNDVVNHKPHPEGIRKVIDALALHPSEVLMVGDALSDVRASRSACVRVAAAMWDSYDPQRVLQASPDYVFYRTREMLEWLRHHVN